MTQLTQLDGLPTSPRAHAALMLTASVSLIALIFLLAAWELRLAPLRPGGSWLVLKVLPLCLILIGVLKRRNRSYQWGSLMIWLYVCEATVRGVSDISAVSRGLAWAELVLALVFFVCVVLVVRPYKQAARARQTK